MKTSKSDVEKYIACRKARDSKFARNFEKGFFRFSAMLKVAREKTEISQTRLAPR